jgi:RNA polymerase sigma factor (TIGR02999 family)
MIGLATFLPARRQSRAMAEADRSEITRLLKKHQDGDEAAFNELLGLIHDELRVMARQRLRHLPSGSTLDTVALINEAYLRLVEDAAIDWQNRAHFFGVVSRAMRWIVVDHARRSSAEKRGGGFDLVALESGLVGFSEPADTVLLIHDAIEHLESFNPRLARMVECRFFVGMSEEEIATALGVTVRTVQRDWLRARAWLLRYVNQGKNGTLDPGAN